MTKLDRNNPSQFKDTTNKGGNFGYVISPFLKILSRTHNKLVYFGHKFKAFYREASKN